MIITPRLFTVARHGQSLRNKWIHGHVFIPEEAKEELARYGDHEVPLTDLGRAQAEELGRHFVVSRRSFDVVYHSEYDRAKETAEIVAKTMGQAREPKILGDIRLRERSPGHLYSLTEVEVVSSFPWFQDYWKQSGWFFARPPGGESLADMYDGRVRQALDEIFAKHNGEKVLVVCHGRTQQVIRLLLDQSPVTTKMPPFRGLPNCGIVTWVNGQSPGIVSV